MREGILEAYTGTVTGLKETEKGASLIMLFSLKLGEVTHGCYLLVNLLLPYVPSILELLQRCFQDEERSDALTKLAYGLIGDLADAYPNGEIKPYLLVNWVASELRSKQRMPQETKKTMRWAREVRRQLLGLARAKVSFLFFFQMVKQATQ